MQGVGDTDTFFFSKRHQNIRNTVLYSAITRVARFINMSMWWTYRSRVGRNVGKKSKCR